MKTMTKSDKLLRLREVLITKQKSQIWLSDNLGISEVTVSNWCNNKCFPSLIMLSKISNLLQVRISDIINENSK